MRAEYHLVYYCNVISTCANRKRKGKPHPNWWYNIYIDNIMRHPNWWYNIYIDNILRLISGYHRHCAE